MGRSHRRETSSDSPCSGGGQGDPTGRLTFHVFPPATSRVFRSSRKMELARSMSPATTYQLKVRISRSGGRVSRSEPAGAGGRQVSTESGLTSASISKGMPGMTGVGSSTGIVYHWSSLGVSRESTQSSRSTTLGMSPGLLTRIDRFVSRGFSLTWSEPVNRVNSLLTTRSP